MEDLDPLAFRIERISMAMKVLKNDQFIKRITITLTKYQDSNLKEI